MTEQFYHQARVPTVILRMSWIHAEDDILNHLTVAGDCFGVPVWNQLMDDQQRASYATGQDAAVALRHPDGPIVMVQVDNEGALYFRDGAYDQDYHPDSVQLFRDYLRVKYKRPSALRTAWSGDEQLTFSTATPPIGFGRSQT